MKWKNVKNELPKKNGLYLCYHPYWPMEIIRFYQGKFNNIGVTNNFPTHWMPLPGPPETK